MIHRCVTLFARDLALPRVDEIIKDARDEFAERIKAAYRPAKG